MALGLPSQEAILLFLIGVAVSVALGIMVSVVVGMTDSVALGIMVSVAVSLAGEVVVILVFILAGAAVDYGVAVRLNVSLEFSLTVSLAVSLAVILAYRVAVDAGSMIHSWRPFVFHPLLIFWNFLLHRFDQERTSNQASLLRFHPAFWDEWLYIPFQGLDKHLLLVIERNPEEGQAAIDYLSTTRQRWAIQEVQIELDTRKLEACTDVNENYEIAS